MKDLETPKIESFIRSLMKGKSEIEIQNAIVSFDRYMDIISEICFDSEFENENDFEASE